MYSVLQNAPDWNWKKGTLTQRRSRTISGLQACLSHSCSILCLCQHFWSANAEILFHPPARVKGQQLNVAAHQAAECLLLDARSPTLLSRTMPLKAYSNMQRLLVLVRTNNEMEMLDTFIMSLCRDALPRCVCPSAFRQRCSGGRRRICEDDLLCDVWWQPRANINDGLVWPSFMSWAVDTLTSH